MGGDIGQRHRAIRVLKVRISKQEGAGVSTVIDPHVQSEGQVTCSLHVNFNAVGSTLKPIFIQKDQLGRFLRDKHLLELLKIFSPLGRVPFRVPQSYFCVTFN